MDLIQFIQFAGRSEFNLKTIAKTDLKQIIGKIRLNKATGLDKITYEQTKLAGESTYDSLLHIII